MNMYMKQMSDNQKLIKVSIDSEGLADQVDSNQQTLILLIHDKKFQALVMDVRKNFNIPAKTGFRAHTKSLQKWAHDLDYAKWDEALYGILSEFPRLNENFLEHISLYLRFNSLYYGPILNHKTGLARLGEHDRDWVSITIYDVPDGKAWQRIKKDVQDHFHRLGVEQKTPIDNFDLKLKALEGKPGLISGVVNEAGEKVNDEALADRLINKTGDLSKEKSSINLIRKYRERLRKEKEKRLG